jgi:hypothetical protein
MLFGFLFPAAWLFLQRGHQYIEMSTNDWIYSHLWIENLLIFLWPSSVLLIADPLDTDNLLAAISVLTNAVYFLFIGAMFSYLAKKKSTAAAIPIVMHLILVAYLLAL